MKKVKKANKIKEEKFKSEDQESIIRFIKILIGVIICVVLIYFITRAFVKKDLTDTKEETPVTEISYSKMVFGTMLNRPYDEYYVFAYSSEDTKAYYYSVLGESYMNEEDSLYIYYVDLEDSMNSKYVSTDGTTNPKATKVEDLRVGDLTLIKVKNGKINKYLENLKDIKNELGIK